MKPSHKFTLNDLRNARKAGQKLAMLTCYDYSTACLMEQTGVPLLLVGDSAANVILGHPSTLPVSLDFMIEIAAAVRRGSPSSFLVADMPFGSYHASASLAVRNICRMVKESSCDCVKLEVAPSHTRLVRKLTDAGVAIMAHIGLRPQSVAVLGGYKAQGRTASATDEIVRQAQLFQKAGAVSVLLEAVPFETAQAVVDAVSIPVVGCGAGPACHAHVVVTHDLLGLTPRRPKFVPDLGHIADAIKDILRRYMESIGNGTYPGPEHAYSMIEKQAAR